MNIFRFIRSCFCTHNYDLSEIEFLPFTNIEGKQVIKYRCIYCGKTLFINL